MSFKGQIPDVFACTILIGQFCKTGQTNKATRVMEILETSGAVPVVRAYNVLISGYCKSGEIDKALQHLERMSVSPD
ncbi:pentatricopeptide repeat-containing protein at1g09900-like protein, partial [Trifolium pratense]